MKWYKKQMDELKKTKSVVSEQTTIRASKKEPTGHSFGDQKMRFKKIAKPGEKRSRPKTDSK